MDQDEVHSGHRVTPCVSCSGVGRARRKRQSIRGVWTCFQGRRSLSNLCFRGGGVMHVFLCCQRCSGASSGTCRSGTRDQACGFFFHRRLRLEKRDHRCTKLDRGRVRCYKIFSQSRDVLCARRVGRSAREHRALRHLLCVTLHLDLELCERLRVACRACASVRIGANRRSPVRRTRRNIAQRNLPLHLEQNGPCGAERGVLCVRSSTARCARRSSGSAAQFRAQHYRRATLMHPPRPQLREAVGKMFLRQTLLASVLLLLHAAPEHRNRVRLEVGLADDGGGRGVVVSVCGGTRGENACDCRDEHSLRVLVTIELCARDSRRRTCRFNASEELPLETHDSIALARKELQVGDACAQRSELISERDVLRREGSNLHRTVHNVLLEPLFCCATLHGHGRELCRCECCPHFRVVRYLRLRRTSGCELHA